MRRPDSTVLTFLLLLSSLVCCIKSLPTANFENSTEIVENSSNVSETDILSPLDFEKTGLMRKNETLENEIKKYMLELSMTNKTLDKKETEAFVRFVLENDKTKIRRKRDFWSHLTLLKIIQHAKRMVKPIVPGTNWCGAGDRADGPGHYGPMEEEDKCCEKHDMCKINILPGGQLDDLHNDSDYTISHCDCDDEFYNCLKSKDSTFGYLIGLSYFNIHEVICITKTHYPQCNDDLNRDKIECAETKSRRDWVLEKFSKDY